MLGKTNPAIDCKWSINGITPQNLMQTASTLVENAFAIIEEICDGSDRNYYPNIRELHAVLPSIWEETLEEKLKQCGWKLRWKKEKMRVYENGETWTRLSFTNPNL